MESDHLKCFLVSTLWFYYIANGTVVYVVNYSKTFVCLEFFARVSFPFFRMSNTFELRSPTTTTLSLNLRFYFSIHSHTLNDYLSSFRFVYCNFRSGFEERKKDSKSNQSTVNFLNCVVVVVGVSFAYCTGVFDWAIRLFIVWVYLSLIFVHNFYYYKLNFPRKPYFSLFRILITHIASFDTIFILLKMSSNSCTKITSMLMRIRIVQNL